MLDGTVIGACMPRHRHREFLRFLKLIDQQTPAGLDFHLIVDNYATHKTPAVKRWIKLHPRFQLHFTPTSASWLNMVERFFAEITRKRIRRGAFKSVAELKDAIIEYLENHNADPKPFIWTKSAGQISKRSPERNKRQKLDNTQTTAGGAFRFHQRSMKVGRFSIILTTGRPAGSAPYPSTGCTDYRSLTLRLQSVLRAVQRLAHAHRADVARDAGGRREAVRRLGRRCHRGVRAHHGR